MKFCLVLCGLSLTGMLNVVASRGVLKRNHHGESPQEIRMNCYREFADKKAACPLEEYPLVSAFYQLQSAEEVENFIREKGPKEFCDGYLPYVECDSSKLENLSEKCRTVLYDLKGFPSYDETVEMNRQSIALVQEICNTKLKFIEDNWVCLMDLAFSREEPNVNECGLFDNFCSNTASTISCVHDVILAEENCNADVADYANDLLGQVRDIYNPMCAYFPDAGRREMLQLLLRR